MGLVDASGKPKAKEKAPDKIGPIPVTWAVIIGIDSDGAIHLIDHEYSYMIRAQRPVHLDDIYSAAFNGGQENPDDWESGYPEEDIVYTVAFVVFQLPEGDILASPDVFLDIVPLRGPTGVQLNGAFGALQAQIVAQKVIEGLGRAAATAAYAEKKNKSSLVTV